MDQTAGSVNLWFGLMDLKRGSVNGLTFEMGKRTANLRFEPQTDPTLKAIEDHVCYTNYTELHYYQSS